MKKIIYLLILCMVLSSKVAYGEELYNVPIGERIAREAALWLGSPYGYTGGDGGYGTEVDCSGLVMQVYKAFGYELPRVSYDQAEQGEQVALNEMIAGDIVCFVYEDGSIGHVGIYIGGNTMIHSPRPGKIVELSSYFEDWGSIKAVYGRRISFESDYVPNALPEETEAVISELISEPNTVKTDHLGESVSDEADTAEKEEAFLPKTITLKIGSPYMDVNGETVPIDDCEDITPCVINNRTHLPLRKVAEELGAEVNWIGGADGKIQIKYGENEISLWLNSEKAVANGITHYMDSAPTLIGGNTFLPIRFIADELGWELVWDGNENTVTLSVS